MRAAEVLLARAASYDPETLRPAVRELFASQADLVAWLGERDPARLVVVKPNWVQESHELDPAVWEPVITHPELLLAVVEALAGHMGGRGTIAICDAPHTYADFAAILARGGLGDRLAALAAGLPELRLEVIDLRREVWVRREGVVVARNPNPADPRGYARFDLGRSSLFFGHPAEGRYYGADYDTAVVNAHHHGETHEYLLAGTPVACDLFVNLPKLKTHKKTGLTCALKNLVGINGDKNWLPHHAEGHDEFPALELRQQLERHVKKLGRRVALALPGVGTWAYRKARNVGLEVLGSSEEVVRNGNWSGNDTCWRMALDLNRALLYGRPGGEWAPSARRYLALVDGVVGGEGNGPLCPRAVASGVLALGRNPAAVDAVAARLMGFDPEALPIVARAFDAHRHPIAEVPLAAVRATEVRTGRSSGLDALAPAVPGGFEPHFGWTRLRRSA